MFGHFVGLALKGLIERNEGISLFVFIRENNSAFSLKFLMNLLSWDNGGIQRVFLLFKNVLNIDQ